MCYFLCRSLDMVTVANRPAAAVTAPLGCSERVSQAEQLGNPWNIDVVDVDPPALVFRGDLSVDHHLIQLAVAGRPLVGVSLELTRQARQ